MAFNPAVGRTAPRSRFRGGRFRALVVGAAVAALVLVLFEGWLTRGWFGGAADEEEPSVTPAAPTVRMPDYALPPPRPTVVERTVYVDRPAPQPSLGPEPRAAYEPPRAIAWSVNPPELDLSWYVDGRRPRLATGCALRPGVSIIPAKLVTEIRSEVGGQAVAEVMSDVFDADGVGRLLVPAGTRAVGVYKTAGLDFQDRRLNFVWTELTFPSGKQIALGEADGLDAAGAMGVGGEVRTRWGQLVATAALLTVFDGIQRGSVGNDQTLASSLQSSASRTTGRIGEDVTERVLDWEPDILIRAGTQIRITPQKTVRVC